jgi:hypothetical protein
MGRNQLEHQLDPKFTQLKSLIHLLAQQLDELKHEPNIPSQKPNKDSA